MDNGLQARDYAAQITYAMCPVYVASRRWLTHEDIKVRLHKNVANREAILRGAARSGALTRIDCSRTEHE